MLAPLAALLASFALAAPHPSPSGLKSPNQLASSSDGHFKVSFTMRNRTLERSGNFVVQEGSQASYVAGGEVAWPVRGAKGVGVDFKKVATIVNCVVVKDPNHKNRARAECQFELSGPVKSETGPKELDVPDVTTFQFQTAFEADSGKPVVLVDEADKRLVVTLEELR